MSAAQATSNPSLSERRQALAAATSHAVSLHAFSFLASPVSLHDTTPMTRQLSHLIPQISPTGITNIPLDAFDPIRRIVVEDYDGKFGVHLHDATITFEDD